VSSKISNPQISVDKTANRKSVNFLDEQSANCKSANFPPQDRMKHLILFPPFIAKQSKSWLLICWAKSGKNSGLQITYLQIAKNIGPANHKSANCHTCGRSAKVKNFVSLQIRGFAI
jgi:hypothetical protein